MAPYLVGRGILRDGFCVPALTVVLLLGSSLPLAAPSVLAADGGRTIVLPLRSVGVSDTTIAVARDLLAGELEARGVEVVSLRSQIDRLPTGVDGCDELECARTLARDMDADIAVYGSLSRLGDKIIARVQALRRDADRPHYRDQLTAATEEDLDRVMLRIAEGIALGRMNSEGASVESVIREETDQPLLRATRQGLGFRAGFVFPTGDSYGGVERLTNIRLVFKHEGRDYLVETTTLAGLSFANAFETAEWHIFDLFGGRILGLGNKALYAGAGLGVHSLRIEGESWAYPQHGYYGDGPDQRATTLTLDLGVGFLGLRTYDYQIVMDLRYHYVFEDFDKVDDNGAHGISLVFGTSR